MSQRKGKSIHIDDRPSSIPNHLQIDHLSTFDPVIDPSSSQRILELDIIQEQLAQLLNLASQVLGSLAPPLDHQSPSNLEPIQTFSNSIHQYFELLNKIQLGLRTSMSHLRVSRISTRILFEPAHSSLPHCPVGLGNLNLSHLYSNHHHHRPNHPIQKTPVGRTPILSVGSLVAERDAWSDLVESLLELVKARSDP